MTDSIFLAKVLGLYLLIVGILFLLKMGSIPKIMEAMLENPAIMVINGAITLILGILLVVTHNLWVPDWRVVITLLAWITLLAGIFRVLVAGTQMEGLKKLGLMSGILVVSVLLGGFLVYQGFFAPLS